MVFPKKTPVLQENDTKERRLPDPSSHGQDYSPTEHGLLTSIWTGKITGTSIQSIHVEVSIMLQCIGDTHHQDLEGQDSSPLSTWRMIRQGVCRVKTVECVGTVMR